MPTVDTLVSECSLPAQTFLLVLVPSASLVWDINDSYCPKPILLLLPPPPHAAFFV